MSDRMTQAERDDLIDRVLLPSLPAGTPRETVEQCVRLIESISGTVDAEILAAAIRANAKSGGPGR